MANTYGNNLNIAIYGGSHDAEIGVKMQGFPADLCVDMEALQAFLARRAPGNNALSTPRKEADKPIFLTGLSNGVTNGEPLHAVIRNENTRSSDYSNLKNTPRPGHADPFERKFILRTQIQNRRYLQSCPLRSLLFQVHR